VTHGASLGYRQNVSLGITPAAAASPNSLALFAGQDILSDLEEWLMRSVGKGLRKKRL